MPLLSKAGGYYADFKFEGLESGYFKIIPTDKRQLVYMPGSLKDCEAFGIKFDYSFSSYLVSFLNASDYPSYFEHSDALEQLSNFNIGKAIRFSFIGGQPFTHSGCNLYSLSLAVLGPTEFSLITYGVP